MTLKERFDAFYNKWNGKTADYDGYYGGQCYDLAQFWAKEVGGHTFIGMYAKDIYTQQGSFYTQIPNTPDAVPQVGDIVVWSGNYNGGVGHVGVANGKGDLNTFDCFEQNDPIGSVCHIKTYSYTNVTGWLRPKSEITVQPPVDCSLIIAERDKLNGVITGKDETISHLGDTINAKNAEIATAQTTISSLNSQVLNLTSQLATATEQAKKVSGLTTNLEACETSKQGYATDLSKCQTQVGKIKSQLIPKKYLSKKLYDIIMALE